MRAARARSEVRSWGPRESTPPFDLGRDPYNVSAFGGYGRSRLDMANQLRTDSLNRQQAMAARRASAEVPVQRNSIKQFESRAPINLFGTAYCQFEPCYSR